MLAPLKDRSILLRSNRDDDNRPNSALRQALREARQQLKHSAKQATQEILSLRNQLMNTEQQQRELAQQLAEIRSGQTMLAMGQRLTALQHENDRLHDALQEIWFLERSLAAAHRECANIAAERDQLLTQQSSRRHLPRCDTKTLSQT